MSCSVAHLSLPNIPPQDSSFQGPAHRRETRFFSACVDKPCKQILWARPSPGQSPEVIPRLGQDPTLSGSEQKVTGHQAAGSPAIPAPVAPSQAREEPWNLLLEIPDPPPLGSTAFVVPHPRPSPSGKEAEGGEKGPSRAKQHGKQNTTQKFSCCDALRIFATCKHAPRFKVERLGDAR